MKEWKLEFLNLISVFLEYKKQGKDTEWIKWVKEQSSDQFQHQHYKKEKKICFINT